MLVTNFDSCVYWILLGSQRFVGELPEAGPGGSIPTPSTALSKYLIGGGVHEYTEAGVAETGPGGSGRGRTTEEL